MFNRSKCALILGLIVLSFALSPNADAGIPVFYHHGEQLTEVGDVADAFGEEMNANFGGPAKVGYIYEAFGLFWLDIWSWKGSESGDQRRRGVMKTILDIVNRVAKPIPWSEGDNIPWDDPAFSERMLVEHLSQDHELASRTSATIEEQVGWIFSSLLQSRPARLLDLGCGPGLYVNRLSAIGCECVGIDFSPASIRHARKVAADEGLTSRFIHADIRDAAFGDGFDLVMLIYGQFNVFPRDTAMEILAKAHAALAPGGRLVLEVQSAEEIRREGQVGPSWISASSGLFSDEPHLVLREEFWDEDAATSTTRFMVIDAASGAVHGYALSNEAYFGEELDGALRVAGFGEVQRYPSLTGDAASGDAGLPVLVARR